MEHQKGERDTDGGQAVYYRLPDRSWAQWRERCAAQLCDSEVRDQLQGFVAARFNLSLNRFWHGRKASGRRVSLPAGQCMHFLESFVAIGHGKKGKVYKEWLFARTEANNTGAIEGGVSVLIRDVVREYLRREHGPSFMVSSSDRIPCAGGGTVSLDELVAGMPGPDDMAAEREIQALASQVAPLIMGSMDHRETVAVLAKELGLSLADPVVLDVAGCKKSVLNERHHTACKRVVETLKVRFKREDAGVMRQLVLATFCALSGLVVAQARSNPACKRLFDITEAS